MKTFEFYFKANGYDCSYVFFNITHFINEKECGIKGDKHFEISIEK